MNHIFFSFDRFVRFLTFSRMKIRNSLILSFLTLGLSAMVPNAVQAYTARLDVTLDRAPNETYEGIVRRAEIVARAAIQRGFDRDLLANEVSVVVVGRNSGMASSLISVWVTRSQWQARPETKRWATYYRGSRAFLGF